MFLGFATKSVALCWFLQIATLVLVAYTMGVLPAICSNIYPAGVRISGFNFAYNFGIMTFGGLVSYLLTHLLAYLYDSGKIERPRCDRLTCCRRDWSAFDTSTCPYVDIWECLLHVSTFATTRVALPTGVKPG
jgi:hypothetical protein